MSQHTSQLKCVFIFFDIIRLLHGLLNTIFIGNHSKLLGAKFWTFLCPLSQNIWVWSGVRDFVCCACGGRHVSSLLTWHHETHPYNSDLQRWWLVCLCLKSSAKQMRFLIDRNSHRRGHCAYIWVTADSVLLAVLFQLSVGEFGLSITNSLYPCVLCVRTWLWYSIHETCSCCVCCRDHSGGNKEMRQHYPSISVYGSSSDHVPDITQYVVGHTQRCFKGVLMGKFARFVLFRRIKKCSFNLLCVLDLRVWAFYSFLKY